MLNRIIAVIVSSTILAVGISMLSYIPEEQKEPNIYYMSLSENLIFTFYFSLVLYTIIGIPASWVIDKWRKRYGDHSVVKRYLTGAALYASAGIISGSITFVRIFSSIYS